MIDFSGGKEVMYYLKKEYQWPSTDEWIKKMWYIATAIRKKDILPFAATWMDCEVK